MSTAKQTQRPSVVLADDNTALLVALRQLLEPHFDVVAAVDNGASLVQAVQALAPDLAVVDVSMPKMGGIEAAERLKGASSTKVVFLSMHRETAIVKRAFGAGAFGYVLKGGAFSELVGALQEALHKRRFVSSVLRGKVESEN